MKYYNKILIFSLIVFWFLLDFSYKTSISKHFAYDGFTYRFDIVDFIVFLIFGFLALIIVSRPKTIFLQQVTIISFLLVFIPNGILYYTFHGKFLIFFSSFLWLLGPLLMGFRNYKFSLFKYIDPNKLPKVILAISILLTIPFLFQYGIPTNLSSLLLQDIYDVRSEAMSNSNLFIVYINGPLAKVLVPCTIILAVQYNKKTICFIGVCLQLYLFLVNPQKSVLAFLIIALFFSLFNQPKKQLLYFVICMCFILFVGTWLTTNHNSVYLESYMARRSFFVPALLNEAYFEVFKDEKLYLSYSKINPFMEYKFDLYPAYYVAYMYLGKANSGANTGLIGSGYMDFGFFGVILNIFIYSYLVSWLNREYYNFKFFGLLLILVITFNSSPLLTSLITHGMLVLVLAINEFSLHSKRKLLYEN